MVSPNRLVRPAVLSQPNNPPVNNPPAPAGLTQY